MSSSEDKEGAKPPKPPDDLDLGSDSSTTLGSAGFDQQHNPDPAQATLEVSQPHTMATTAVSQTSTTATTAVSQDNQATVTVSQPSTMATINVSQPPNAATTTVSPQTTATSTESQSIVSHSNVSSSVGDTSLLNRSISIAAHELEAVVDQISPESATAVPQGLVTGGVLATDTPSDPLGSANPAASAAQQSSANVPGGNQFQVTAQVHAEDPASQGAGSANPVPGLPVVSADDVEAATDSGMAPKPTMDTVLLDFTVGRQLSDLQLGLEHSPGSAPSTGQFAAGSALRSGPGTGSMPLPVTDQQGQLSAAPTNLGAIAHTGSNLGATQPANSVPQGFESAANNFPQPIKPPSALIEGAQHPGLTEEAEMPEDGGQQDHAAMEGNSQQTDTQYPSTSADPQSDNPGAVGQNVPAISFDPKAVANLLQAASAGHFWDAPGPLKGATAEHMQELTAVLHKMAAAQKPAETDPQRDESDLEDENILVRRASRSTSASGDLSSSSDSSSEPDTASDEGSHKNSSQKKMKGTSVEGVKDLFDQAEGDVFVVSDESGDECGSAKDNDSCQRWASRVSEELDWMVRYPNAVPFVHTRVVSTDDGWYRGEDCASPSEVATPGKHAILPAADGSLALKADAVLPGAPSGRTKYGDRFLERRVFHAKAKREGHEELDPVAQATLDERAQENREALARDSFWAAEMERASYLPGETDTTVNFAVETDDGKKAIPYRVAAPMTWEYPYAFGQAQEPLQDRLVTASLYGMRLTRPGYTDPQSRPAPPAALESPAAKEAACVAYVTDADVSCSQEPSCRVANSNDGREAFICPEACCEALEGMPCYFATVEQWIVHWNTFHVAVAPVITCIVAGCPAKFCTGPETVDAFFRHVQLRHKDLSVDGKWPRLNQMVRIGMGIEPNTCYWPPSAGNGPHLRPDQVTPLSPEEMQDPFLAARWVARTEFHALVRKGRPKSTKGGKARKGDRSSSRDAPKAKQRRGRDGARSTTDESDSGAASSSTSLTGATTSSRGTERGRKRPTGRGSTFTRQSARQQREAAKEAGHSTQPGPFPIALREERTGSRKQDRSLSSNRAAASAHRQKRHSGDPTGDPDRSTKDDSAGSEKGMGKKSTSSSSSGPKVSGGGSGFRRRSPDSAAVPIDSHFPGDGTVPESAIAVETVDGRVAYEGTPEEPILRYEDCLVLNKAGKQTTKFWTASLLRVEQEGLKNTKSPLLQSRLLCGRRCLAYPFGVRPTAGITGADPGHTWMPHITARTSK